MKKLISVILVLFLLFGITGCSSEDSGGKSEKPRKSIVGEWYYTGYYLSRGYGTILKYNFTYEPGFEFLSDGTFIDRTVWGAYESECTGTYIYDEVSNNLHLTITDNEGTPHTYTIEYERSADGWSFDGTELTIYGYVFKTTMPKGDLLKKLIGTWKISQMPSEEDLYATPFDELVFNKDGSFECSLPGGKCHGYFAVNEAEQILSVSYVPEGATDNNDWYRASLCWNLFETQADDGFCWGLRDDSTLNFVGITYTKN